MEFIGIDKLKKKTIYKEKLYKQIKDIIKNSTNFNKNSAKRKFLINERLKSLTILNDFTQTFQDEELKLRHLNNEFKIFKEKLQKLIIIDKTRSNSAEIKGRIRQCIQIIIDDLIQKGYIESFDREEVIKKLNYNKLFHMCISVIFSCVEYTSTKEERFEFKGDLTENDIIYVKFLHRLQTALYLHFTSIIIDGHNQMSEALKEIYDHHRINTLNDRLFYELSNQIGEILLFSLGIYGEIREIPTMSEGGRFKSTNIVKLPNSIFKEFIPAAHLPQICEPDVTYEMISDYLLYQKRVKNGISSMDLSKKTIKALKISQKKKFVINNEAIKLFGFLDSLPYEIVKDIKSLPFVPLSVFKHLEDEIEQLGSLIKPENKEKYISLTLEHKKKKIGEERSINFEKNGLSKEEVDRIRKLYKIETEYKSKITLRYMHNTILKFAEIFKNFPIFFINSLDYRGRMYPWNFMFNRSSGVYKYLLVEFAKQKINSETLDMMRETFCKSVGTKEFSLNKEEIIKKHNKKFFYYILLGIEIEKLNEMGNNLNTSFMMEIDQKSSSSVLLSIVLGDYNLAKDSNIFEKSDIDPPTVLMHKSEKYFEKLIEEDSLKTLKSTRDIHKYLMMCLNYNQTEYGRKKKISEYIQKHEDCKIIAKEYENFVDSIYDRLSAKKGIFNQIISYYLDNSKKYQKPIIIDTIDGSRIEWTIFPKKRKKDKKNNKKKKYKSPITGQFKSYHYEEFNTNEIKKHKLLLGALPSFIHSIDAGLMRLIIIDVFESCGYIINHLHDSIQYNPKYYKNVMDSIARVYSDAQIQKCLDEKLLVNLRNRLLEEKREEFDKLVNKLKNCSFKEIIIDIDKFESESMFPHE